jgi:hypothetical protein
MRLDVSPRRADITPGIPLSITVTIANTSTVIGGYVLRVLGADPSWVQLEAEQISLFPDETRTITATITAPVGIPAGLRRVAVQVRELTPPEDSSVTEIDLTVPSAESMQVRLDPMAVTAGKQAAFSVIVANTGNTVLERRLAGADEEGKVEFEFSPDVVSLAPGEHAVVDMRAKARRHIAGSPTVRRLSVYLDPARAEDFFDDADGESPPARGNDDPPAANGTFLQRAFLSRGALSLVGLLAAVTVFAIVITVAMSRLVSQTTADRDLALQIAAARNSGGAGGTAGVSGTVRLLTSGKAVAGVSVGVYAASDTSTPVATTATDSKGAYAVTDLAAGKYKLSFRGAGFVQIWYPGTATDADATTITLTAGERHAGLDVSVGGVPATISGTVIGDDVAAATLYLETVPGSTGTADGSARPLDAAPGTPPPPPDNGDAVVQTVPIGSDGTFTLAAVPSPSVYDLVVTKTGYATSTQRINVGAGANRTGVEIMLSKGDGLISGTVSSASGPLGGVTITATTGQSSANTRSLTSGAVGSFTLRTLPTPATFTVVASKAGYASQTITLTLAAGQKLTGVAITLGQSSGSLAGTVKVTGGSSAAGVSVTVTNGKLTVQTTTQSGRDLGAWTVTGLPIPGTYTVTFSRPDLAAQTVSVALDAGGNVTAGSQSTTVTSSGITVAMQSATAVVYGTVTQSGGATVCDSQNHLGEATVTVASSTTSYTVISASKPTSDCGDYRLEAIPPGTYTLTVSAGSGTTPTSQVITLQAGDVQRHNVELARPASLRGKVVDDSGKPQPGWTVFLFAASEYPNGTPRTTTTDSDGTFTFDGVPADSYVLAVGPTSDPANAVVSVNETVTPSEQLVLPKPIEASAGD